MTVQQGKVETRRGDTVSATLVDFPGEEPSILVTVDDVDDTVVPTAEFTVREAAEFRELLRELCEKAARGAGWTSRR